MPYIQANNLNIHYFDRGEGSPVVMSHAATVSGLEMDWVARIIEKQGYRVVRPDLRAHGKTENTAPDLNMPRMVSDMEAFIHELDLGPVHAVGYSMGGGVTLSTARKSPDMYESIVVMGSNYRAPTPQRLVEVLGPPDSRHPVVKMVFDYATGFPPGWGPTVDAYSKITCPVLLILGDRDEFIDVEDNVKLYRQMPNARLCVVPNCDHLGLVRHPIVIDAIEHFYTSLR